MSISTSRSRARAARAASDIDQKLNYIADAIAALAKVIGDIEADVKRIKARV